MSKSPYVAQIYKDAADEWRWRFLAPNGKVIADGSEGYTRIHGARRAVTRLLKIIALGQVVVRLA